MSAQTLKCANCNLVISEVLAFINNKLDVMDNESLVRICASAFTIDEVEKAKALLFDSIKTNKRNISRRKDGKIQRDLEDIISVLKNTDPELVPIFVAKELNKLPPVTFDHVDVTGLLKELVWLKSEVQEIKQNYATNQQLEDLENKFHDHRYSSFLSTQCRVNTRRGACLDSGPMALLTPTQESTADQQDNDISHKSDSLFLHVTAPATDIERNATSCSHAPLEEHTPDNCKMSLSHSQAAVAGNVAPTYTFANMQCGNETTRQVSFQASFTGNKSEHLLSRSVSAEQGSSSTLNVNRSQVSTATRKLLYSEVTGNGEEGKTTKQDDEWTLVQKKRLKYRFIGCRGKAESSLDCKFKAADTKIPLFISNVHKDVSESDIVDYIYQKTKEKVSLVKIKMRKQRDYNAYKVLVTKHKIDTFLDDNLWPSGISFRRFVNTWERLSNKSSPNNDIEAN